MKKIILLILILIVSYSCVTQKKCNQKFPSEVITRDSIVYRTNTIIKDSIIYIKVPIEVGTIEGNINCDSLGAQMKKVTIDNKRLKMTIEVINGKLIAVSTCKEDSLQAIIQRQMTIIDSLHVKATLVKDPLIKFEMKWYEQLFFYIGVIASLIGLFYFGIKYLKNKFGLK